MMRRPIVTTFVKSSSRLEKLGRKILIDVIPDQQGQMDDAEAAMKETTGVMAGHDGLLVKMSRTAGRGATEMPTAGMLETKIEINKIQDSIGAPETRIPGRRNAKARAEAGTNRAGSVMIPPKIPTEPRKRSLQCATGSGVETGKVLIAIGTEVLDSNRILNGWIQRSEMKRSRHIRRKTSNAGRKR
jgi:hypothetical protein